MWANYLTATGQSHMSSRPPPPSPPAKCLLSHSDRGPQRPTSCDTNQEGAAAQLLSLSLLSLFVFLSSLSVFLPFFPYFPLCRSPSLSFVSVSNPQFHSFSPHLPPVSIFPPLPFLLSCLVRLAKYGYNYFFTFELVNTVPILFVVSPEIKA